MGRNALVLHLFLLFLACLESNCDCSAKTNFTMWSCQGLIWKGFVDEPIGAELLCFGVRRLTLVIDSLNATRWKFDVSAPFGFPSRNTSTWFPSERRTVERGRTEQQWKIMHYEVNENKPLLDIFNNSHLVVTVNQQFRLFNSSDLPMSLFWGRLSERMKACSLVPSLPAASTTASSDIDTQTGSSTVGIELTTIPIMTTSPILISTEQPVSPSTTSALAATKDAVVALLTMIATSSVLSLIIVALLIVIIVLIIKLRRMRKVENTRRTISSQPLSSSGPMSSRLELDRNSEKQETWDNRKERERRQHKLAEIPSIRDDVEKPPKKVRPKYIKTKTMTMPSFD